MHCKCRSTAINSNPILGFAEERQKPDLTKIREVLSGKKRSAKVAETC
jgi:hypothetical protein